MIERLATVIYYFCCLSAAAIFMAGFFSFASEEKGKGIDFSNPLVWWVLAIAVSVYLIGFCINYILTGRKWV